MLNILAANAFSWNEILYIIVGAILALIGSFAAQFLFSWIDNRIKKKNSLKQINLEIHTSVGKLIDGTPVMNQTFSRIKILNDSNFLIQDYKIKILEDDFFAERINERFFKAIKDCERVSYILPSKDFVNIDTMLNVKNNHTKYFNKTKLIKYEIYNKKEKLIKIDYIRFTEDFSMNGLQ